MNIPEEYSLSWPLEVAGVSTICEVACVDGEWSLPRFRPEVGEAAGYLLEVELDCLGRLVTTSLAVSADWPCPDDILVRAHARVLAYDPSNRKALEFFQSLAAKWPPIPPHKPRPVSSVVSRAMQDDALPF